MFTKEDVKRYAWYAVQWAFKQKESFKKIDCDLYVESELYEVEQLKETYTRGEAYLAAERSVRAAINNILLEDNPKPIREIINNEIDNVKLF